MAGKIDWDTQIGRRLKLRDLHVFATVVNGRSMAKAAIQLGVSQPAVSDVIADLEHALGVRLFDRSPQGALPTVYGQTLYKRTVAAFDELKLGIREIEHLSDPTVGELKIGCAESMAAGILPALLQRFAERYPRIVLHVEHAVSATLDVPELRDRSLDVFLARLANPESEYDDLHAEHLFDDHMVILAGARSVWASRSHVDLAELVDAPWILTRPGSWNHRALEHAFQSKNLPMPRIAMVTFSVHIRSYLLAHGPYVTALPNSVMMSDVDRSELKVLPVDLPNRPWPVAMVTLKNRTQSPIVQLFTDHVREYAKHMVRRTPRA